MPDRGPAGQSQPMARCRRPGAQVPSAPSSACRRAAAVVRSTPPAPNCPSGPSACRPSADGGGAQVLHRSSMKILLTRLPVSLYAELDLEQPVFRRRSQARGQRGERWRQCLRQHRRDARGRHRQRCPGHRRLGSRPARSLHAAWRLVVDERLRLASRCRRSAADLAYSEIRAWSFRLETDRQLPQARVERSSSRRCLG